MAPNAPTSSAPRPDGVVVWHVSGRLDLDGAVFVAEDLAKHRPETLLLDLSLLTSYEPDAMRALSAALDNCAAAQPRFACVALVPDAPGVRMAMRVVAMTLGGAFRSGALFEIAYSAPVAEIILTRIAQDRLRETKPARRRTSSASMPAVREPGRGGDPDR